MVAAANKELTADYYPYGKILREYNPQAEKYLLTGSERDVETGLDHFDFRNFDSDIGRWISPDALSDQTPSWTPYRFNFCNPVIFIDPKGLSETVYQDEDGKELANTNDGNDATVTVSNENKEGFLKEYNSIKDQGKDGSIMHNESWIRRFGMNMSAAEGMNVPQWSISAINGSSKSQSQESGGSVGVRLAGVGALLEAGKFTVYNKDVWLSLKNMKFNSTAWGGNQWTGGRSISQGISGKIGLAGKAVGLFGLGLTYADYKQGNISGTQAALDGGFGLLGTFGGPVGAGAGLGWEAGKKWGPSKWYGNDNTKWFK